MSASRGLPAELQLRLLGSVLEFMNMSGVSERDIRESFERGLVQVPKVKENARRRDEDRPGNINVSAELLRLWHRDARFIDSDAKPKPLSLTQGKNSIKAVIKRLDPTSDSTEIIKSLKAVKLIKRTSNGLYLPTSQSAIVDQLHPVLVEHVARTVIRLVSTVCRNTDPTGRSLPLIERHAAIPDLNPSDREAFAEFTRSQGMAYLESVDDWLQQRRSRRVSPTARSRKVGVAASVHLVAYLGDEPGQVSLPITAPAARRATTASREVRA